MYCIKCGVNLADSEKQCPLCGTVPFHPDIERKVTPSLYPENTYPKTQVNTILSLTIISLIFIMVLSTILLVDLQVNKSVTWSGFVTGALILAYVSFILPFWFKKPNAVIFVPCSFATLGAYLAYINFACDGNWFITFALPLVGVLGITTTAVVALIKYVKRGKLYIFGGAFLLLAASTFPLELLINITFSKPRLVFWFVYPALALTFLGGLLIFLAICRPARESMQKKFFI